MIPKSSSKDCKKTTNLARMFGVVVLLEFALFVYSTESGDSVAKGIHRTYARVGAWVNTTARHDENTNAVHGLFAILFATWAISDRYALDSRLGR